MKALRASWLLQAVRSVSDMYGMRSQALLLRKRRLQRIVLDDARKSLKKPMMPSYALAIIVASSGTLCSQVLTIKAEGSIRQYVDSARGPNCMLSSTQVGTRYTVTIKFSLEDPAPESCLYAGLVCRSRFVSFRDDWRLHL